MRNYLLVALVAVAACSGDDGVNHLADAPPLPDAPADAAIDSPDPMVTLTTTIAGAGMGTVTSSPAGITCSNGTCTGDFDPETVVTLTAVPDTGSVFTGWTGVCTGATPTCEVTLSQAAAVTAWFDIAQYAVTVTKSGAGMGTVMGSGLNCGATCTMMVDHGTVLSLTATPANLSVFAGWGGACSGMAGCMVTVTGPTAISANFPLDTLTLFVSKGGNGAGTVTATGINCGTDCDETYTAGQMVTLTAAASTGSTFTGWSGGGCSGTSTCTVTMTAATTVTATFTLQQFVLTVARAGNGSGNVASATTGIACGTDCMETYNYNTMVTLTATPSTGSTFTGWSGACTGTAMCVVTMTQARSVTATFTLMQFTLTASVTGNGTITSAPAGIACGADCTQAYNYGQMVTLTAAAGTGSTFTGWGGACTGTGACSVTMDMARTVTATFTLNNYTLSVATNGGNGTGTVTGTGISCGADCSESYPFGTMVTLTAAASTGSTFTGWSGACTGTGACTVTISAATSVTAAFTLQRFTLTVANNGGNGAGTVTATGINCGADCSEMYNYNTMVTLTATPSTGSTFTGWSGACTGTGACTVTMTQARSVTAAFTLMQFQLLVTPGGLGTGTVTGTGINCGTDCMENIDYNTMVTLTATPATGSTFTGWMGACTGTGTCTVTMTQARSVTANFGVATFVLDVTRAGLGGGSVTSVPTGINCPATACMATYDYNTSVVLTATADANSDFAGWSGTGATGCTGLGTCTVTMTQARSVTATFDRKPRTLTITFMGNGSGSVTANGQTCTGTCNLTFPHGSAITMSATASTAVSTQSTFLGWAGAGCTGTGGCSFTITAATNVDATFRLDPNFMFTTSEIFTGNLNGIDGADRECQRLADAAGLVGRYRAYLSGTTFAAFERFTTPRGWVRVDGRPIANRIDEFGLATLPNPPSVDERGNDLSQTNRRVWTATNGDLTRTSNCQNGQSPGDWSTTQARTMSGDLLSTGVEVLTGGSVWPCAEPSHLYCFGVDRRALAF